MRYTRKFRRQREAKTDYRKRLGLLKSGKVRFVVRHTNKHIRVHAVQYTPAGDITLVMATSMELKKYGWTGHTGNRSAAYLVGLLCAKKAKAKKITGGILDIGLRMPLSKNIEFSALKGLVDGGIAIPHKEEVLPDEKMVKGEGLIKNAGEFEKVKQKVTAHE